MTFVKMRSVFFGLTTKLLSKLFFVEMPPLISVTALIRKENTFLFQELSYKKGLGLPGGIMQTNETAEEALKREVKEETNLDVISSTYLGSVVSSSIGIATLSLVFDVVVTGKEKDSIEGSLLWLLPQNAQGKLAYLSAEEALSRFVFLEAGAPEVTGR
jgi:ADP-ribose pyrophosphatase YjhB (NUDIX family)